MDTYGRKTDSAFRGGLEAKKIPVRDAGGIPGLPCWRRRLRRVVSRDVQEGKEEKQEYHTRLGLRHCQVTFFQRVPQYISKWLLMVVVVVMWELGTARARLVYGEICFFISSRLAGF
jgi:hypothetical protein